jgi:hypothetical protein
VHVPFTFIKFCRKTENYKLFFIAILYVASSNTLYYNGNQIKISQKAFHKRQICLSFQGLVLNSILLYSIFLFADHKCYINTILVLLLQERRVPKVSWILAFLSSLRMLLSASRLWLSLISARMPLSKSSLQIM